MTLKKYWIAAFAAGVVVMGAVAQASTGVSTALGQANATPSQNAQAPGGDSSAGLKTGTALQAELSKGLDVKKAKSGDPIEAKLMEDVRANGKTVLHRGSKLLGHVTEAQAKTKENAESRLGIVFEKAVAKGGEETAFNGLIVALAPAREGSPSIAGDPGTLSSAPAMGGQPFGAGHSMGGPSASSAPAVNSTMGNDTAAVTANGTLTATSRGVAGMEGVTLTRASAANQGSVIRSANRNVKLEGGTQMVLQVTGEAAAH